MLKPLSKTCKVELFSDEEGIRLICNTVDDDDCPLKSAGALGTQCFKSDGEPQTDASSSRFPQETWASPHHRRRGSPSRHKRVKRYGAMVAMNEEEENIFEAEEPEEPEEPKKDDEEEEDEDEGFFQPLVEEFESEGGYLFGLVLLKDEEGDYFVDVQLDNVTVQLPLTDFIAMIEAFKNAIIPAKEATKL